MEPHAIHLLRPDEFVTMCGIEKRSVYTRKPSNITCKTCLKMYQGNEGWYEKKSKN